MKKKQVIEEIETYLRDTLSATPSDSRQEAEEIEKLLTMYRFLPVREFTDTDMICPSTLVELEFNGSRAFYFIVPRGGGLVTRIDGQPVQVITPQSPIGEALLGRRVGDVVRVSVRESFREYRILSIV